MELMKKEIEKLHRESMSFTLEKIAETLDGADELDEHAEPVDNAIFFNFSNRVTLSINSILTLRLPGSRFCGWTFKCKKSICYYSL